MFAVVDTFNGRVISRHRTLVAAARAREKIARALTGGAYLPMTLAQLDRSGSGLKPPTAGGRTILAGVVQAVPLHEIDAAVDEVVHERWLRAGGAHGG